jgi:putative SOS response-associated peptidase YedK
MREVLPPGEFIMCTRYVLTPDDLWESLESDYTENDQGMLFLSEDKTDQWVSQMEDEFDITRWHYRPRISFNLAPTNRGMVIIREDGLRAAVEMKFGFKRAWEQGGRKKFNPGTNFRFDNLLPNLPVYTDKELLVNRSKRGNWMYREAFEKKQFCLIPVRGFIEFDTVEREVKLKTIKTVKSFKVPYLTELRTQKMALIAGLWEYNEGEFRFTFGTTEPNDLVRRFHHDRFPVFLLSREEQDLWLNPEVPVEEKIRLGLAPADSELFQSWAVSDTINNTRNKGKAVLKREEGSLIQIAV